MRGNLFSSFGGGDSEMKKRAYDQRERRHVCVQVVERNRHMRIIEPQKDRIRESGTEVSSDSESRSSAQ